MTRALVSQHHFRAFFQVHEILHYLRESHNIRSIGAHCMEADPERLDFFAIHAMRCNERFVPARL